MSNFAAVEFVLMLLNGASPPVYESVANLSNVQYERSNSEEDVSVKGDARFKKLYSAGAQMSMSISCDFVADDSALFAALKTAAFSTTPQIQARLDDGDDTFTGIFHISNFSQTGGAFGAVTGSISLSSSGTITKGNS
jgi:predicted secreted protein